MKTLPLTLTLRPCRYEFLKKNPILTLDVIFKSSHSPNIFLQLQIL